MNTAAHMFARLPVGPGDPLARDIGVERPEEADRLRRRASSKKNAYRDAVAALNRAGTLKLDAAQKKRSPMSSRRQSIPRPPPVPANIWPLIRSPRTAPGSTGSWPIATISSSLRSPNGRWRPSASSARPRMRPPRRPSARPASSFSKASKRRLREVQRDRRKILCLAPVPDRQALARRAEVTPSAAESRSGFSLTIRVAR